MVAPPRPIDFQSWDAIGAGATTEFRLNAGVFMLTLFGTWGGGNAALQRKITDDNPAAPTWVPVPAIAGTHPIAADGAAVFYLPAGAYRLNITTANPVSGRIEKIASGFGP